MTKAEYIELVNRQLDNPFHPNYIAYRISLVLNELLSRTFSEKKSLELYNQYTKPYYDQPVLYDSDHNFYYVEIPEKLINVPGIAGGVRSVEPNNNSFDILFVPTTVQRHKTLKNLDVGRVNRTIRYMVFTDRIEFPEDRRLEDIKKVKLRLCISFVSYDDEEEVPVPYGLEDSMIKMTIQGLRNKPFEDNRNDNNEMTK